MRRKCCAKVLMLRSPHAAAESCTAAIRRATQFRALPDFQFFSISLPVCSYFASSSLISFFISTTNEGTGSGQCFSSVALPRWALHFVVALLLATIRLVARKISWLRGEIVIWGAHAPRVLAKAPSPSRTLARTTTRNRLEQKITKRTKSLLKNSGFLRFLLFRFSAASA
jgi:hypothetical protein